MSPAWRPSSSAAVRRTASARSYSSSRSTDKESARHLPRTIRPCFSTRSAASRTRSETVSKVVECSPMIQPNTEAQATVPVECPHSSSRFNFRNPAFFESLGVAASSSKTSATSSTPTSASRCSRTRCLASRLMSRESAVPVNPGGQPGDEVSEVRREIGQILSRELRHRLSIRILPLRCTQS